MSNSKLAEIRMISPHRTSPRRHAIDKITIHHMAGNASVERCGEEFQRPGKRASSNYGIGSDGRIAVYVDEADCSWASSSPENDHRAVTIEVANCEGAPDWAVSGKAMRALIELCVDICRRNGIRRLTYTGDASGNLTMHRMFVATACPGPYLTQRMPMIASMVNAQLEKNEKTEKEEEVQMRYRKIEEIPRGLREETEAFVRDGVLCGRGGSAGLDVTEDMLRTLIMCRRMVVKALGRGEAE